MEGHAFPLGLQNCKNVVNNTNFWGKQFIKKFFVFNVKNQFHFIFTAFRRVFAQQKQSQAVAVFLNSAECLTLNFYLNFRTTIVIGNKTAIFTICFKQDCVTNRRALLVCLYI